MSESKHLFVPRSYNRKLGPIACTYASLNTCPPTCALKGSGCYAEQAFVRRNAGLGTLTRGQVCTAISEHFKGKREQVIRYHVSGDLDPVRWTANGGGTLQTDASYCQLVSYNSVIGRDNTGWLYTHRTGTRDLEMYCGLLRSPETQRVCVIPSADSIEDAERIREWFPYRIALCAPSEPRDRERFRQALLHRTGIKSFTCPAAVEDATTCDKCRVCSHLGRVAVLFPVHGSSQRAIESRVIADMKGDSNV